MAQVIAGPADWRAADLAANTDWIERFSPAECAEIDTALRTAQARGASLETLTREDFPLPKVGLRLAGVRDAIENGRGIVVLRGLPTGPYTKDELRLIYWGIGARLERAESLLTGRSLVAQLDDVHPAGQGGVGELGQVAALAPRIRTQIQPGGSKTGNRLVHTATLAR